MQQDFVTKCLSCSLEYRKRQNVCPLKRSHVGEGNDLSAVSTQGNDSSWRLDRSVPPWPEGRQTVVRCSGFKSRFARLLFNRFRWADHYLLWCVFFFIQLTCAHMFTLYFGLPPNKVWPFDLPTLNLAKDYRIQKWTDCEMINVVYGCSGVVCRQHVAIVSARCMFCIYTTNGPYRMYRLISTALAKPTRGQIHPKETNWLLGVIQIDTCRSNLACLANAHSWKLMVFNSLDLEVRNNLLNNVLLSFSDDVCIIYYAILTHRVFGNKLLIHHSI